MTKEMTDVQMVRLLKKEVKGIVRRHEECMMQRDNLVIALQDMIAAFCPGDDWAHVPVRVEGDLAIAAACGDIAGTLPEESEYFMGH